MLSWKRSMWAKKLYFCKNNLLQTKHSKVWRLWEVAKCNFNSVEDPNMTLHFLQPWSSSPWTFGPYSKSSTFILLEVPFCKCCCCCWLTTCCCCICCWLIKCDCCGCWWLLIMCCGCCGCWCCFCCCCCCCFCFFALVLCTGCAWLITWLTWCCWFGIFWIWKKSFWKIVWGV